MTSMAKSYIKYHEKAILPTKPRPSDAAWDLYSVEDFSIGPGETVVVNTGIGIDWHNFGKMQVEKFPDMYPTEEYYYNDNPGYALVLPRSGLAYKYNITVVNSPGLIDRGYTGEIKVILHRLYTPKPNMIRRFEDSKVKFVAGSRIAQLLFVNSRIPHGFIKPEEADHSIRGDNGFGSSGV